MRMVPKSGCPVLGQTAVNSGQVWTMVYSRPGWRLGKVSMSAISGIIP
jgi:hypothetical protein